MQNTGEGVTIWASSVLSSSSSHCVLPILPAILLAPPSPVSRCHHRHSPPLPTVMVVSLSLSAPHQPMVVVPHCCCCGRCSPSPLVVAGSSSPSPPRRCSLRAVARGGSWGCCCRERMVLLLCRRHHRRSHPSRPRLLFVVPCPVVPHCPPVVLAVAHLLTLQAGARSGGGRWWGRGLLSWSISGTYNKSRTKLVERKRIRNE